MFSINYPIGGSSIFSGAFCVDRMLWIELSIARQACTRPRNQFVLGKWYHDVHHNHPSDSHELSRSSSVKLEIRKRCDCDWNELSMVQVEDILPARTLAGIPSGRSKSPQIRIVQSGATDQLND